MAIFSQDPQLGLIKKDFSQGHSEMGCIAGEVSKKEILNIGYGEQQEVVQDSDEGSLLFSLSISPKGAQRNVGWSEGGREGEHMTDSR